MEMNNQLEMLTAREQLMEDIDCIVSAQYGQGNEELADEMIKLLCDAVCKNFPANWHKLPVSFLYSRRPTPCASWGTVHQTRTRSQNRVL